MLVKSQVKYIQSLGQKKHRDETGLFIAEGPKIVAELLQEVPSQIQELYATETWAGNHKDIAKAISLTIVSETELERVSQLKTPHEVVAVVKQFEKPGKISVDGQWTLALDTIQDPGNFGTIIRIADWFGIKTIVAHHGSADMYNPKVVQATMSSIARVTVMYTDLEEWMEQQKDVSVYAAMLEGEDVTRLHKKNPGIILIGNESKGIDKTLEPFITRRITIPLKGKAESLNAAVATGIILSHLTS